MFFSDKRAEGPEGVNEKALCVRPEIMEEPIACTPIAVMFPEDCCDSDTLSNCASQEDLSLWVRRRAKGFGKFLGVSCSGFEDKIMNLLLDIEKNWRTSEANGSKRRNKSKDRGKRELKQLCCSFNFDRTGRKEGEARRNHSQT